LALSNESLKKQDRPTNIQKPVVLYFGPTEVTGWCPKISSRRYTGEKNGPGIASEPTLKMWTNFLINKLRGFGTNF
jgi:hypothetical protein